MNQIKIDNYTKGVLTVIALCLTLITFENLIPKAHASENTEVPLNPTPKYGVVPLNEDGSINVKLISSETLNVNVKEIGGGYISYGGPLPVEVDNEVDVYVTN